MKCIQPRLVYGKNKPCEDWFDFSECQTLTDVKNEVDRVIHYFNNERPQWHRKKMTPVEYRNHLLTA